MQKYKLIAIDLDETLLNSQKEISPQNLAAIRKAHKHGVEIVIATGRAYHGARKYAKILDFPNSKVINFGGSQITNYSTEENILEKLLSNDQIVSVINFAKKYDLHVQTYEGEKYMFEKKTPESEIYAKGTGYTGEICDIINYDYKSCPKVLIVVKESNIDEYYALAKKEFGESFNISKSSNRYIEFNAKGSNKGSALEYLANQLGVKQSEIIAVGDNSIDESMIKYAGLGVCVSNATPSMLEIADYISPSNDEHALEHIIEKFIFNN